MTRLAIPCVTISQVLRKACLRLRSLESRFSRFHSIHDTAIETAFFSELKVDDRTLERIPQQPALLLKQKGLLRIDNVRCRPQVVAISAGTTRTSIGKLSLPRMRLRMSFSP